jgi:phage anti-repressor protein
LERGRAFLFYVLEGKSMNELVNVTEHGGRPGVDARDLHERLEVGRDFSNWIKDRIEKYEFIEDKDFSPNLAKSTGGRPGIDYILSIQAAMLIASGENSPAGVAISKALANQVGQAIENRAQTMENLTASVHRQDQIIAKQGEAIQDLRLLEKRYGDFEESVKNHIHYVEEGYKKIAEGHRFENQRVLGLFMTAVLDMTGGRTLVLDAYRIYVEKYDGKLSLREFGLDVPFRNVNICLIYTNEGAVWTGCRLR